MMYELNNELNYDEMTEQEVIDYVRHFLRTEYRISENYVGFRYLLCAIIMLLEDREYLNFITKSLYVEIAVKCKSTDSAVERGLRTLSMRLFDRHRDKEPFCYYDRYLLNGQFVDELTYMVERRLNKKYSLNK